MLPAVWFDVRGSSSCVSRLVVVNFGNSRWPRRIGLWHTDHRIILSQPSYRRIYHGSKGLHEALSMLLKIVLRVDLCDHGLDEIQTPVLAETLLWVPTATASM